MFAREIITNLSTDDLLAMLYQACDIPRHEVRDLAQPVVETMEVILAQISATELSKIMREELMALYVIASSKNHCALECLMRHGLDLNRVDHSGLTYLMYQAMPACSRKFLIRHGANINQETERGNPFSVACENCDADDCVKFLNLSPWINLDAKMRGAHYNGLCGREVFARAFPRANNARLTSNPIAIATFLRAMHPRLGCDSPARDFARECAPLLAYIARVILRKRAIIA